jgi:hypothetical protein
MSYLILMEGYAPLAEQLDDIQVRSGAPATAFRCLKSHGEDDPSHLADLNATLDRMDLTPEESRLLGLCAFSVIDSLAALFEELLRNHRDGSFVRSTREPLHAGT